MFVGQVKGSLAQCGISGFVAHEDIEPSKQWRSAIKEATCHIFVAFLDDGFHRSQWCDQEVGCVVGRGVPILPIRPVGFDRDSERHDGFIEEHQDVFLDDASMWQQLWVAQQVLNGLLTHAGTRDVGVQALAEAFVNPGSFDQTRLLWSLILRQPLIEGAQLRRLEYAVQTNRQVYDAMVPHKRNVPDLVLDLVKKFELPPATYRYDDEPF